MYETGSVLLTDLYQLTMLQAYYVQGMQEQATFEMYVRRLPPNRNFLMAAGLEQVLEYLENLRFVPRELEWLHTQAGFRTDFVDYLASLRFSGKVAAMREGTVCFAEEPLIQVTAPLPEAQLVESRIINLLQYSTLIASKAAQRENCGARQNAGRFRYATSPWCGSRFAGGPRQLCSRICRVGDRPGGTALRHSSVRNHGTLLHSGTRG